jgi:hypothetical protein
MSDKLIKDDKDIETMGECLDWAKELLARRSDKQKDSQIAIAIIASAIFADRMKGYRSLK